jgi:hypothetical protein
VAKGKFRCLSDTVADSARQLVVSEREHQEQFDELSLLHAWGSELCLMIIGPPRVRNHLSVQMWAATLRHTKMAGELAMLWAAVSPVVQSVLGWSPDETFQVEVMGELLAKFRILEELCLRLERSGGRIYDLLLGPPLGQSRWADLPEEATG